MVGFIAVGWSLCISNFAFHIQNIQPKQICLVNENKKKYLYFDENLKKNKKNNL